jgi:hypothetical protein
MKRLFLTLISITLILSILATGQTNAGTTPGKSVSLMQQRIAAIKFVPRQIREGNRRLRYTIKARYPQSLAAGRDARLVKLNQELRSLMSKEVLDFKKDFVAPEERMSEAGSYYESNYMTELAANDLVSIYFGVSTYYEGAAHPNHNSLVFNYDLKTGQKLNLADLFKPNSDYLSVISDYSIKALMKQKAPDPDADWIKEGAGAKEENYKSWNITRQGLKVTFDPYQVASYAEGPHEVVIPYAVLKDVIDPNGPLARMR